MQGTSVCGRKFRKVDPRSRTRSGSVACPTRFRKSLLRADIGSRDGAGALGGLGALGALGCSERADRRSFLKKIASPSLWSRCDVDVMSSSLASSVGHLAGVLQLRDKAASAAFAAVSGPILHKARSQIARQIISAATDACSGPLALNEELDTLLPSLKDVISDLPTAAGDCISSDPAQRCSGFHRGGREAEGVLVKAGISWRGRRDASNR